MPDQGGGRRQQARRRCEQEYRELKAQLEGLGYILQGSLRERWMQCGKEACRCYTDPAARHGPYYQWSWAEQGKTRSIYLDADQAALCREWIGNHRELERLLKRMRAVSLRAARLHKIDRKGVRRKCGK
jgi:hypothetical protein|tara:strand:+ start:347 stop:733 length:387 start_codon:yes stop_codon:yes gene_type:complete